MSKIKIDYGQFRKRCSQTELEIVQSVEGIQEIKGDANSCYYKDNGSDILFVAHMDTVQKTTHFNYMKILNDSVIYCPKLDDRAGVYTILDLLPRLGIKTDILLTTDEETCNTSASLFKTKKKYNWIAEFDRSGEDVVNYEMTTKDFTKAMVEVGFKPSTGSYSDICELTDLDCCAINVGIGYQNAHSQYAHMFVSQYVRNMKRFVQFYHRFKTVYFECHTQPRAKWSYGAYSTPVWDDGYELSSRHTIDSRSKDYIEPTEYNELTGTVIQTEKQRCTQCHSHLEYDGNGYYWCWACDAGFSYDYHDDRLDLDYCTNEKGEITGNKHSDIY